MRDYDEVARTVLKRRDEQIARRKKHLHALRRNTAAVFSFCLVAAAGVGIWRNEALKSTVPDKFNKDTVIESVTAEAQDTTASTSNTRQKNTTPVHTDASLESIITEIPTETTSVHTASVETEKIPVYVQNELFRTEIQYQTAQTESVNTEPVLEVIQTVSTQMPLTTTQTDISEPPDVFNDERSITMKRIVAFLSAIMAASSFTVPNANAEYQLDTSRYSFYAPYIKKLESGELDPDINMDGTFDLTDCRILNWYIEREWYDTVLDISPETESNIVKVGDYCQDGEIDGLDADTLIYYYILTHDVKMEYCTPTYYDPDFVPVVNHGYVINKTAEYCFALEFFSDMNFMLAGYPAIEKMADSGEIDLDANSDGKTDITDYADFSIFISEVMGGNVFFKSERSILPPDEWQHIYNELHKIPWIDINGSGNYWFVSDYISAYFAAHIDLSHEYFDNDFYNELIPGSGDKKLGDLLRAGAVSMGIVPDDYANEFCKFDDSIFKEEFYAYYTDVKSGFAETPDINMDGVVNYNDYLDSDTYFADIICGRTADESELPSDVWNNIVNNCDFNGNGKSGDIYDIMTVQIFVILEDAKDFDTKPENGTGMTYEQGFNILSSMDIERSGDANVDGNITIADSIAVLQYLANCEKYPLDAKQRFNADIANTGDGITAADASEIQKRLLKKI